MTSVPGAPWPALTLPRLAAGGCGRVGLPFAASGPRVSFVPRPPHLGKVPGGWWPGRARETSLKFGANRAEDVGGYRREMKIQLSPHTRGQKGAGSPAPHSPPRQPPATCAHRAPEMWPRHRGTGFYVLI